MTPDEKAHYYGRMEKNFPQFLKAMERLVAVPSYLKEDDDYPHVPAIKKVLDETMALMKDLGIVRMPIQTVTMDGRKLVKAIP